jgi:TolA-binding protein
LHRQVRYAEAAPYLREVCGADDMLTQNASYHLADCYLRAGDKTNAMYSFAMASSAEYDASIAEDALFNYGKLQYDLGGGRFNEAINVLSRYVDAYPQSERTADARTLLIAAYYNSKNYSEAYRAIKSLDNPDGEAMLALQKIAYFNGLEAYAAGDLEAAEEALRESMNSGGNAKYSALASFWLGEVAYASGREKEALQRYKNFLGRAPKGSNEYAMANYNAGYCYFNSGDMSLAARSFDAFLASHSAKDSYYADAMNRRGDVHYAKREFDAAVACYDKSFAVGGVEGYYAQYQKAITQGVQNKREAKISSLSAIVQANRGDYVDDALYELGKTYIADEQYSNGVRALESFVEQYPASQLYTQALSDLGLAYMNLGQKDKALEYYDKIVKSAPHSSLSKGALQGIREIYVDGGNADAYFDYAQKAGVDGDMSLTTRDSLSYAAAQKLYLGSKTQEAAISFDNYLKTYANGHYRNDALFFLSDCHIRNGNDEQAIETLSALASQGRTQYSERVLDRLSSMCYNMQKWQQAAEAYRQLYDVASDSALRKSSASGYVASTLKYADDEGIVRMADDVEKFDLITEIARRKARYAKAHALLRGGDEKAAMEVFKVLGAEVKSVEGAEARFRMIEQEYKAKNHDKAEKMVYAFSDSNTPHNYWLAKAFILLGDIYLDRGDTFQARATYQSVVDGYSPADDGIVEEAKLKISKME